VYNKQPYSCNADCWSAGICLLGLFVGQGLNTQRDKAAYRMVAETKEGLGDKPVHMLLKALLEEDPDKRLTARQALEHEVFAKFELKVPPVRLIPSVDVAMGTVHPEMSTGVKKGDIVKTPLHTRMDVICKELGCFNPITVSPFLSSNKRTLTLSSSAKTSAAVRYAELCPEIAEVWPEHCALVAMKIFEMEHYDLTGGEVRTK
jgi:hypothetical protein